MVQETTSKSKEYLELDGEIIELLPATNFEIELENGQTIRAYLSGKMRMHRIRLAVGDKVKVKISPYDLGKGIIVYRY
ncbi:MAG: translation initiation factor IF-1 [Patescibacteria group bacterium]|jgi:translation initiation factor IF-1|nr:translation initiation factor IF-1 [Patescibacteria group bacterium]